MWYFILLALLLFDNGATVIAVTYGVEEANPIQAFGMETLGIMAWFVVATLLKVFLWLALPLTKAIKATRLLTMVYTALAIYHLQHLEYILWAM